MKLSTYNITEKFKDKVKKEKIKKKKRMMKYGTDVVAVGGIILIVTAFLVLGGKNTEPLSYVNADRDIVQSENPEARLKLDVREWNMEDDIYTIRWDGDTAYWYSLIQNKDMVKLWDENVYIVPCISEEAAAVRGSRAKEKIENTKREIESLKKKQEEAEQFNKVLKEAVKEAQEKIKDAEKESVNAATDSSETAGVNTEKYYEAASINEKIKEFSSQLDEKMTSNNATVNQVEKYVFLPNEFVSTDEKSNFLIIGKNSIYFLVGDSNHQQKFYNMDFNGQNMQLISSEYNNETVEQAYQKLLDIVNIDYRNNYK